jgi:hypothetical protein
VVVQHASGSPAPSGRAASRALGTAVRVSHQRARRGFLEPTPWPGGGGEAPMAGSRWPGPMAVGFRAAPLALSGFQMRQRPSRSVQNLWPWRLHGHQAEKMSVFGDKNKWYDRIDPKTQGGLFKKSQKLMLHAVAALRNGLHLVPVALILAQLLRCLGPRLAVLVAPVLTTIMIVVPVCFAPFKGRCTRRRGKFKKKRKEKKEERWQTNNSYSCQTLNKREPPHIPAHKL